MVGAVVWRQPHHWRAGVLGVQTVEGVLKIYISAGFTERERLRGMRDELWKAGHDVISTWLDEVAKPDGMTMDTFNRKLAIKDVAEITAADLLISDHLAPSTSGGRDIEYGVALGRHHKILIWIVGVPPRTSPFHLVADAFYPDWDYLLKAAREMK